jgi:hypothetical protein
LEEIETLLLKHNQVKEAVVLFNENEPGDESLCAYFIPASKDVCDDDGSGGTSNLSNRLKRFLLQTLPAYMVPSYCVPVERFPLTPNGKINMEALPDPRRISADTGIYIPPRDELEWKLAELWADILSIGIETIGIDDNFFDRGGHSLRATILVPVYTKFFRWKFHSAKYSAIPPLRPSQSLSKRRRKANTLLLSQ